MQLPKLKCAHLLLLATIALSSAPQASAATLTFDELLDPADQTPAVPDGYGGIIWSSGNWRYYGESQSPYTPHSGTNRIYSYSADNTFFFAAGPSYFDGAWFAGGSGTGDVVQFHLSFAGVEVFTSSSLFITDTPTFLSSGYSGLVDAVSISENPVVRPNDTDFVMDDVVVRQAAPVPEPGGAGVITLLLGTAAYAIKQRRRSAKGTAACGHVLSGTFAVAAELSR